MKVNINNKDIELKYSFRSFIIYENITDQPFQPTGKMSEFITFFYSTLMASDQSLVLEYDDFLDWLDNNPDNLEEFIKWIADNVNKNNKLTKKASNKGTEESKSKN